MAAPIEPYKKVKITNVLGTKCKSLSLSGNSIEIDFAQLVNLEEFRFYALRNDVNPVLDFTNLVNLKSLTANSYNGTIVGTFTLPTSIIGNLEKFYLENIDNSNTINMPSIPLSSNVKEVGLVNLLSYGISLQSLLVVPPTMANCYKFVANGNDLDQTQVDNILIALDANGLNQGTCDVGGGSNAMPSGAGAAAAANLISKGWQVSTN